jgi:asparagine synthetase B (glutamine-hydrolysing)
MEIKIDLNSLNFKIKNNLKIKTKKILFNNHKILIFGNFYEKINDFNFFKNLNNISSRNGEFFFIYVNKKNNKILFGNSSTSYYQIFFKKDNKYLHLTLDIFKLIDSNSILNLEKISEWLCLNGRNLNEQSFINNVSILHPGTSLFISNQQIKIKEVKPFSYKKKKIKENIYLNFLKILKDSINLRVKKTNTRIIFGLSGGYDSRIILSLIDEEIKKKIIAITTGDNFSLEKIVAKKVSKILDVTHKNIFITKNKYYKDISKILKYGNYSNIFKNGIKEEVYKKLFNEYKSKFFLQGNALDVLISSSFSSKNLYKIRKKNDFIKWYIKRNTLFNSDEISKIFKKKTLSYKK